MIISTYKKHHTVLIGLTLFLLLIIAFWYYIAFPSENGWNRVIYLFLLSYFASKLLIKHFPYGNNVIIISVDIACALESFLTITQLLGYRTSVNCLFTMTGSFRNPGPLGCFLSVCISLLTAFCVKERKMQDYSIIHRLSFVLTAIIAIVAFIILPSTQSRSAMLALGCSMVFLAIGTERIRTKLKPILKRYGIWLLLGVAALGAGAYMFKKPSADGRLFMDKICIKAMCDNGWRGAGIGHFGEAYGNAQASYFKKQIDEKGKDDLDWRAINEHDRMTADCPDNAFNEYLFIGVEAGLVAMLLFICGIVTAIVVSFRRKTIWCYGLTAFAVFAMFSYPLHVKQFQIMFPVLLAACVSDMGAIARNDDKVPTTPFCRDRKRLAGLAAMVAVLAVLSVTMASRLTEIRIHKQAESAWNKAERWHKMEYYDYVVENCDTLMPYMKHDYRFLFAYGQSLNKTDNHEKSDSILMLGTKISSDPMFWNVMGNNSLAQGRYSEAEERYKHAFYMVPNRLYPLTLLAKLYHIEGDTVRFLDMAEKVETFVPKIENANTERLRAEIREIREGYNIEAIKDDE